MGNQNALHPEIGISNRQDAKGFKLFFCFFGVLAVQVIS
jgi:hypothetical protein